MSFFYFDDIFHTVNKNVDKKCTLLSGYKPLMKEISNGGVN